MASSTWMVQVLDRQSLCTLIDSMLSVRTKEQEVVFAVRYCAYISSWVRSVFNFPWCSCWAKQFFIFNKDVFMRNIKSGSLRCLLWSYGGFSPLPLPFYFVMEAWMEFWTRFMCMSCFCAIFWSRASKHHYLAVFFSNKLVIHHPDLWKRFCVAPQSPKFKLLGKAKWFTFGNYILKILL